MEELYRTYLTQGERAGLRYALASPRNIPMGAIGSQTGNRSGSSLEFQEHRDYQPGDDLRRINWNIFGRTDKFVIKLYREEVSPYVDIMIDGSRSMALGNSKKTEATVGLAALFATAAINAGYTHTTWLVQDAFKAIPNGRKRPSFWEQVDFSYAGAIADTFNRFSPPWHMHGIRIFVSDLLWLGEPRTILAYLAQKASAVILVQVLAEADVEPPQHGNLRLVDSETNEVLEILLDSVVEKRYRDALSRHLQNWHRAAKECGVFFTTLVAEKILPEWHLDELVKAELLKIK